MKILNLQYISIPRYRRLAKEGSWIVIGQIVSVLGALALVRVLTELLSPSQYGELALGLTVANLVNMVVIGALNNGISRFYIISVENHGLLNYLIAVRRVMIYASLVVVFIGILLILGLHFLGYSQWIGLVVALLVFALLSGYNTTFSSIQSAARQRAIVVFHGCLEILLKVLLVGGLLLWVGSSSATVVVGYALSSLFVIGSQLVFLRKLIPPGGLRGNQNFNWAYKIWTYSWPISTWGIFLWLYHSSDRWVLQYFTTMEELGRYAVLFQLGNAPLSMVVGMGMTFLGPIFFQRSGDATDPVRNADVHQLVWRTTFGCLAITFLAFFLGFVLHDLAFNVLVAVKYRSVSYLLPWMLLAGGLFASAQILGMKLACDMKIREMMMSKIITALLGVILNCVGAFMAGTSGVVAAVLATSFVYLVWTIRLVYLYGNHLTRSES